MLDVFRERFVAAMTLRKMSQADIAKLTGYGRSNISQYCAGSRHPNRRTLPILARVLRVDEGWLVGYSDNMDGSTSNKEQLIEFYDALNAVNQSKLLDYAKELTDSEYGEDVA